MFKRERRVEFSEQSIIDTLDRLELALRTSPGACSCQSQGGLTVEIPRRLNKSMNRFYIEKKIIVRGTFETVFFNDEIKVKKAPLIFKNDFRISSFEKPFTRKAAYV